jgi:hypothetical protein
VTRPTSETDNSQFHRYRRDAVLLHRPYPPHSGRRTNSKFGGLPRLPDHYEWPCTSHGAPLHFLAQIDCADIKYPTPLPERGVLFFFGRDDEEQIWNHGGTAHDDCRVIYALDAFAATPPRQPPDDLQPIGGYYSRPAWRDLLRKGEPGPKVHVEWPIVPLPITSWPHVLPTDQQDEPTSFLGRLLQILKGAKQDDSQSNGIGWRLRGAKPGESWQEAQARLKAYDEEHNRLLVAAFAEATGEEPRDTANSIQAKLAAARSVFFDAEDGREAYPSHWLTIHYAARALLHRPESVSSVTGDEPAIVAAAEDWLRRSNEAGLDSFVPRLERSAFRDWLRGLRRPDDEQPLPFSAADLVFASMVATIRAWSGDPARAERIPASTYKNLCFQFSHFSDYFGLQFSQMLGHAPSAQEPRSPNDPTICLLNLASEDALGWMFGDVGYCTFWISPKDLARRDFSNAWGTIEGH